MIEVIPLKFGSAFKRAFSQPQVFNSFVSDVIGIPIQVNTVHSEYEYKKPVGFVKSRYDLFAEDEKNRLIIEIQQAKEEDYFERFFYYHMISLIEQVPDYSAYWFTKTVYTIVVLTSVHKDDSIQFSYAMQDLSLLDEYNKRLNIYPHRLIFLTPRLVNEQTPPALRKWMEFIKDSLDGKMDEKLYTCDPFLAILNVIQSSTITPEEFAEIKSDAAWENVKQRMWSEGKAEGIAEGEIKGKMELIKRLIIRRFGSLPAWAVQKIDTANITQLELWAEAIFDVKDIATLLELS